MKPKLRFQIQQAQLEELEREKWDHVCEIEGSDLYGSISDAPQLVEYDWSV